MRGSGCVECCCFRSRGDDAERAQQGSGREEEEELAEMFVTTLQLAAESRLPEAAACLSRA